MGFKDRIKSFKRIAASQLLENPKNWRTHDDFQQTSLQAILGQVGLADAVIAYESPQTGLLTIIDGHLRVRSVPPNQKLPVLLLDVTDEEADFVLATHDSITEMAGTDSLKLDSLLDEVRQSLALSESTEALDALFDEIASGADVVKIQGPSGGAAGSPEAIKFRDWVLFGDEESAALLASKFEAYLSQHHTTIGLEEKIIDAISSQ